MTQRSLVWKDQAKSGQTPISTSQDNTQQNLRLEYGNHLLQLFRPPPSLTALNLPSQAGGVFNVTGGASGVGKELASILYGAGGIVYIAGRFLGKAQQDIKDVKDSSASNTTPGGLKFLRVSLDDLSTIKPAVESFTKAETCLHVFFNNAGVSLPPNIPSAQQHKLQMATNCLGLYLLIQLLLPILRSTAKSSHEPGSVRVVWTSSIAVETQAPQGCITSADLGLSEDGILLAAPNTSTTSSQCKHAVTKAGNWLLASELAKEVHDERILSITQNLGNMNTSLTRHMPKIRPHGLATTLQASYGCLY